MKRTIDEQNEIIIRSRFGHETRGAVGDTTNLRINEEMLESVRNHRKIYGITSKIAIIRNYLRTKNFVKTTLCA
jgi:hypothetical protein